MRNNTFRLTVEKVTKLRGKIIESEKLRKLIKEILGENYNDSRSYKTIYYLKSRGFLIDLKKNYYYIKLPEDSINEEDIVDRNYRTLLNKKLKNLIKNKRYIGSLKALEIELGIHEMPDEILIVNPEKQGTENFILEKKILFKTYNTKNKDLFNHFYKATYTTIIDNNKIRIAKPELAILETLYNTSTIQKAYGEELIKKWLKKHKKDFNIGIIETVLKENKHNSSTNRLSNITNNIDTELSNKLKKLIKKYGYKVY